jgi:4-hydroxy-4-methyl-2-oxoglutarate aldolase
MITERALLTIRREFRRPDTKSVGRFAGAATVHLVDAMGGRGALGHQIKAVNRASATFTGTALTCYAGPDDTLAILAALEVAQPGDVVVAATEDFKGSAVVGDLFAAIARTQRVAAIVTDGLARDSEGIAASGLPVFASGVSPNSAARSGPGTVGLPVDISGVHISPGKAA